MMDVEGNKEGYKTSSFEIQCSTFDIQFMATYYQARGVH